MDTKVKLYFERAENKLILANANFSLSIDNKIKQQLGINSERTFFNDVISDAYYSIFFAAKSYLANKSIFIFAPEEHRKTYEEFKKFVDNGKLDKELLQIYDDAVSKAEELLKIFFREKDKRGRFTYRINSNANIPFAKESLNNAKKFVSSVRGLIKI